MRHSELTSTATPSITTAETKQSTIPAGMRRGFIDDARRAETPHLVTCDGLSHTNLTKPGQFERELSARARWCEKYAAGDFEIEPYVSACRFRFARIGIANLFRIWFETDLRSRSTARH